MPIMNIGILYSAKWAVRAIDSGVTMFDEIPKTKKVTIQEYVNLYAGPEVEIHFRYSAILNIVYVTFTHGLALPILFPIAVFGLVNMYISEKFLFAYFYRKPPLFDNKINHQALIILEYAPLCMVLMGYWQLGNRQTFFGEVESRDNGNEILNPHHALFDFDHGVDASLLLLIHIPVFLFLSRTNRLLQKLAYRIGAYKKVEDFDDNWDYTEDVDEQLGSYWKCLSGLD